MQPVSAIFRAAPFGPMEMDTHAGGQSTPNDRHVEVLCLGVQDPMRGSCCHLSLFILSLESGRPNSSKAPVHLMDGREASDVPRRPRGRAAVTGLQLRSYELEMPGDGVVAGSLAHTACRREGRPNSVPTDESRLI